MLYKSDRPTEVKYKLQVENKSEWISLKNYAGLSEVKANYYINLCQMAKPYVSSYRNIRMIQDD